MMPGVPIVGDGIVKGVGRQGLVERRVEDRHLRDTRGTGFGRFLCRGDWKGCGAAPKG